MFCKVLRTPQPRQNLPGTLKSEANEFYKTETKPVSDCFDIMQCRTKTGYANTQADVLAKKLLCAQILYAFNVILIQRSK